MNTALLALLAIVGPYSFAATESSSRLLPAVCRIVGVSESLPIGSSAFDTAVLRRFSSLCCGSILEEMFERTSTEGLYAEIIGSGRSVSVSWHKVDVSTGVRVRMMIRFGDTWQPLSVRSAVASYPIPPPPAEDLAPLPKSATDPLPFRDGSQNKASMNE